MFLVNSCFYSACMAKLRLGSRAMLVDRVLAGAVILVGIVCQFCDSTVAPADIAFVKMHVLFGLLLGCAVVVRFNGENRRSSGGSTPDICAFCRHQKRLVYLLLYGLAGMKQIINLAMYIRPGGGGASDGLTSGVQPTNDGTAFPSFDDFQIYLVYGVLSIMLIRVLAGVWNARRASAGVIRADFADPLDAARRPKIA